MDKNSISEDETITPVLRDVELLSKKLYSFGRKVFLGTVNFVRLLLNFAVRKIIILSIVGALAGTAAYFYSNYFENSYESSLLVKSNINTWEQLVSDVHYFNSLIAKGKTDLLSKELNISKEDAGTLNSVDIKPSATYSQKIGLIEKLNTHMDSSTLNKVDYTALMKFEDMAFTESYVIRAKASNGFVFGKIEKSLIDHFENSPLLQDKLKIKRARLIADKEMYQKKLVDLDTLQHVLNQAILENARSGNSQQKTSISLSENVQDQTISPIDVSEKYIAYHQELSQIEEKIAKLDNSYEIVSHFNRFGIESGWSTLKKMTYAILYGVGATFLLLLLLYFLKKKSLDA